MKAIITDAGFASRYLPITKTIPKAMIPIGAKPVMQLCVEECAEAGIDEIIIVATPNTKGKEIVVAFNARYFSECLKNITDEYININFTSPIAPCTITATENSEYLYLILPVRIVN